ncbi:MAG: hypothetical protein JNK04_07965 [Myxococcales bacterium]|nr:hypothetical protein [Myxococcales bacterium]
MASGSGYCFAAWRGVYILDFRDTPTRESLDATIEGKRKIQSLFPSGLYVFNIIDGQKPAPDGEVRNYAAKKQDEDHAGVLAHITVVRGDGFRPSTIRSLLTGLYLMSRTPFPRKVFAHLHDGTTWLGAHVNDAAFGSDLLSVLHEVRSR